MRSARIPVAIALCLPVWSSSALAARLPASKKSPTAVFSESEKLGAETALWHSLESKSPKAPNSLELHPTAARVLNFLRGTPRAKARKYLEEKVTEAEASFGEPITRLKEGAVPDMLLFRAEKAAALRIFDRTPKEVTEGFVVAGRSEIRVPSLEGAPAVTATVEPRKIFYQSWQPKAGVEPSGVIWVVSPGYTETGRNFYEQINLLNAQGDHVIAMDHQWAGFTSPGAGAADERGTVDRGLGVARDVIAVATLAQGLAGQRYGAKGRVAILGNSMGAGPGAYGAAALLNGLSRIDLKLSGKAEGLELADLAEPQKLALALESPFFGYTPTRTNKEDAIVGRIPGLRDLHLPAGETKVLNPSPLAQRWGLHAAREDSIQTAKTLLAAQPDLATLGRLMRASPFKGQVAVLQAADDNLANPTETREFLKPLDGRTRFSWFKSSYHPLPDTPEKHAALLAARGWLLQ